MNKIVLREKDIPRETVILRESGYTRLLRAVVEYADSGLAYSDKYAQKRGKERKKTLVEMKGGKCERCGYSKALSALDFHHREKSENSIGIGRACKAFNDYAYKTLIIPEVMERCDLLCANCHREETWKPRDLHRDN